MSKHEVGHSFLARLGKTKLRPGGVVATNWLLAHGQLNSDSQVLEVACNMGTTLINVAQKYHCHVIGVDQDTKALTKATQNIEKRGLTQQVSVIHGNALNLPFDDNSFDVLINEAMLTMLNEKAKDKALTEYYRVLKPGGILLTHDVCLFTTDTAQKEALIDQLSHTINVHVSPLTALDWRKLFETHGFDNTQQSGQMTLMNPIGMVQDEGFWRTLKIIRNGLKKENRPMFKAMFNFFKQNKQQLGYIANCSVKKVG